MRTKPVAVPIVAYNPTEARRFWAAEKSLIANHGKRHPDAKLFEVETFSAGIEQLWAVSAVEAFGWATRKYGHRSKITVTEREPT